MPSPGAQEHETENSTSFLRPSTMERLWAWEERIRRRIHNFRLPIKDVRLLRIVQLAYFTTPIVVGYAIMQRVIPAPSEAVQPGTVLSQEHSAATEQQKRALQKVLDDAADRHRQSYGRG